MEGCTHAGLLTRCELQVSNKKLRFYDNEEMSGEPAVLELAGTTIRLPNEKQAEKDGQKYMLDVIASLRKTTVERLACTTDRDYEQWIEMFAGMGMIDENDSETKERETMVRSSIGGSYAHHPAIAGGMRVRRTLACLLVCLLCVSCWKRRLSDAMCCIAPAYIDGHVH